MSSLLRRPSFARRATPWALLLGATLALRLEGAARADELAGTAAADALFREAVELAKRAEFDKAAAKFRASYAVEPALGTLLGLAMAEERGGKVGAAYTHYGELLDRARVAGDHAREEEARLRLSQLEPRVAKIVLTSDVRVEPSARIELDGVSLPVEALGTAIPVERGTHIVHVTTSSSEKSETIDIHEAGEIRVALPVAAPLSTLPSAAPVAPEAPRAGSGDGTFRAIGFAAGGAGLAALAASAYFWVRADSDYRSARQVCPGANCDASARGRIDSGKSLDGLSQALLFVGLGAVAGGTTLVLLDRKPHHQGEVRAAIGPNSIVVRAAF